MDAENAWKAISDRVETALLAMEKKRRKAYSRGILTALVVGAVVGMCFVYLGFGSVVFTIAMVLCFLIVMAIVLASTFMNLDRQYKSDIMPILVGEVCPDATYDAKSGVDENTFFSSMVYKRHAETLFAHEDGISGTIGHTRFVFCEAHLSYTETTTVNGKKKKNSVRQFDGMAFDADFDKMLSGNIIATTQKSVEGLDSTFQKMRVENESFSKTFDIYTTDVDECQNVVTPFIQNSFSNLYNAIKRNMGESDMTISFYKNRMLILVPSFRNRFEARIFMRLKSERVKEDFMVIKEMVSVVENMVK